MLPRARQDRLSIQNLIVALLLATAALFLGARLHAGQAMDEDFAVYLQEAENIIHGRPVMETGVLYAVDPDAAPGEQGAATFPPVVPLVLAPVVGVFGVNLLALKFAQLGLLLVTFALVTLLRRRLGFSLFEIAAALALFCVTPEILYQVNDIGSDLPFLFFLVVALLAAEAALAAPPARRLMRALLFGLAVFIAFEARLVAVALLPAAALAQIVRQKRATDPVTLLAPGGAFAVLWLLQAMLFRQNSAYGLVYSYKFFDVVPNLKNYYWHLLAPWPHGAMAHITPFLLVAVALLAATGIFQGLRRGQVTAWFCVFYFVLLMVVPNLNAGLRYLVPIFLFVNAFVARGAAWTATALGLDEGRARACAAAAAGALILLMLSILSGPDSNSYGAGTASSSQVFRFLSDRTDPAALVAARKYRAFHLFTRRQTVRPPLAALRSADNLSRWLAQSHIDYLVLKKSAAWGGNDYSDCPRSPLCEQTVSGAETVFENPDYRVYRLRK